MAKLFVNGITLNGQRATGAGNASAATDLVPLGQIQNLLNGLDWKLHVRLATTTNINITSPGSSFDSVTAAVGDRILLMGQTTASQNNIYIYQGASVAMTLAADAVQGELDTADTVSVSEGSVNANKSFTLNTKNPITVGTTALSWVQNNAALSYMNGTGLLLSGQTFSIDTSKVPLKYAANLGDGSASTFTVTHGLASLDVMINIYLVATGELVEVDISNRTANGFTVSFATVPTSGQYRITVMG